MLDGQMNANVNKKAKTRKKKNDVVSNTQCKAAQSGSRGPESQANKPHAAAKCKH